MTHTQNGHWTSRALLIFSAVAATAFYFLQWFRPYPGNVVLKWLPVAALALYAWRNRRATGGLALTVALLFHSIGDVLLEIDRKALFLHAVGGFLAGHVLYAVCFYQNRGPLSSMQMARRVIAVSLLVVAGGMSSVLIPRLHGVLAIAVPIYMVAITTMAMLAQKTRFKSWAAPLGAVLYMFSDAVIGWDAFVEPLSWGIVVIWPTYIGAQMLITLGVTRSGLPEAN